MANETTALPGEPASARIAREIRGLILAGEIAVSERLPGETVLAQRFGVSRPTVREALMRLAAQNLVVSRRGAQGGTFVARMGPKEAAEQVATATTLLFEGLAHPIAELAEARRAQLAAIAPFAAERRGEADLEAMRTEVALERGADLGHLEFAASVTRFTRALADAARNPMLGLALAGVVEAMEPLLARIEWRGQERAEIAARHARIAATIERHDATGAVAELDRLADLLLPLMQTVDLDRGTAARALGAR